MKRIEAALRAHALSFPEAREDFPWGERVAKVGGRVFVFLGRGEGGLSMSVKLPGSATLALDLPFASPTGYGLGRSGWVTARFEAGEKPPLDLLKRWIDESYRAVAPKKLVARLAAGGGKKEARRAGKAPAV
ncbi:MAG TPA: MmcQ/YjbR family DNA-binding protein [Vicinamibacteria bacterium]